MFHFCRRWADNNGPLLLQPNLLPLSLSRIASCRVSPPRWHRLVHSPPPLSSLIPIVVEQTVREIRLTCLLHGWCIRAPHVSTHTGPRREGLRYLFKAPERANHMFDGTSMFNFTCNPWLYCSGHFTVRTLHYIHINMTPICYIIVTESVIFECMHTDQWWIFKFDSSTVAVPAIWGSKVAHSHIHQQSRFVLQLYRHHINLHGYIILYMLAYKVLPVCGPMQCLCNWLIDTLAITFYVGGQLCFMSHRANSKV